MKIVSCRLHPYALPLRWALRGPQGVVDTREGLVLELRDEFGHAGYAEAAPAWWVGSEPVDTARAALERFQREVSTGALELGERCLDRSDKAANGVVPAPEVSPAARHAIESALIDLRARNGGTTMAAVIAADHLQGRLDLAGLATKGLDLRAGGLPASLPVNALLGGDGPGELASRAREARAAGFSTLKLKVGYGRVPAAELVAAVRSATDGRARLRLDANRAWSFEEARRELESIHAPDIEYIEEPLGSSDARELAELGTATGCALAADESAESEDGVRRLIEARAVSALVLKPMRIGSLARIASMAAEAGAAGMRVIFTDSIESAAGRHVTAQIAAALGERGAAIGLGGAFLLARDLDGLPPEAAPAVDIRDCPRAEVLEAGNPTS